MPRCALNRRSILGMCKSRARDWLWMSGCPIKETTNVGLVLLASVFQGRIWTSAFRLHMETGRCSSGPPEPNVQIFLLRSALTNLWSVDLRHEERSVDVETPLNGRKRRNFRSFHSASLAWNLDPRFYYEADYLIGNYKPFTDRLIFVN